MLKDMFVSFRENFKEKSRNPFLGLYVIVWFIRNWELVYSLFNFEKGTLLAEKIAYVKMYYSDLTFIKSLGLNILWTFGLLILTYLLLAISRFITNFAEKQIIPLMIKITDSKSIVLKSEYQKVRTERNDLQNRLDNERDAKAKLEGRIKELENNLSSIGEDNPGIDEYLIFVEKLEKANLTKDFLSTCAMINKGQLISNDHSPKDKFVELGLIQHSGTSGTRSKGYNITAMGQEVLRHLRIQ